MKLLKLETLKTRYSVRSPAPNGRYRAPAPSALTKLFAFCADRRPATLPALPIESPRRRRPPHSTTNNNLLFQRTRALAFFRERQTRTDLGPPALEVLLADTRCHPPTLHHPSLHPPYPVCWVYSRPSSDTELLEPLAYHGPRFPCSLGREGLAPKLHHVRIHTTGPNKALSEIGYEAPQDVVKQLIARPRLEPRLEPQHHQ
ncbi:hypothetical protein EVAR_44181_1 [Eumeta japonica]|uniref:Uncharacterized protein n=1 Tax=Eumeta variegata TaxID=151549 RepID=A0A4C1W0R5_EUMVA|nr:hypothetical protein EVAR_44181_1 [Eumeta japonica]